MISCFIYSAIVKQVSPGFYQYRKLRRKEKSTLIKISVLFVLNLVLSNSSIKFNSLALDQVLMLEYYQIYRCFVVLFLQLQRFFNCYYLENEDPQSFIFPSFQ